MVIILNFTYQISNIELITKAQPVLTKNMAKILQAVISKLLNQNGNGIQHNLVTETNIQE
jgi:hypothetical protein